MATNSSSVARVRIQKKPKTVHEKELITYFRAKIVEYLRLELIEEEGREKYQVWAKGTWGRSEYQLWTLHSKKPREWSSLDRAVAHIREVYEYRGRVIIDI